MTDDKEIKSEELDSDNLALELNFAPSWARSDPDANLQRFRNADYSQDGEESRSSGGRRDGGRERRPRREFDRDRRGGERDRMSRPPRREFNRDRPRSDAPHRRESNPGIQQEGNRDRRPQGDHQRRFSREDRPALPIEIRTLPEQRALGGVIRRIQTSHRAFPLRDIAWLFLNNPASCLLRLEPNKDEQNLSLFQCKVCGMPGLTEEEIRKHLETHHMEDFFDVEEVDCDPPSGTFLCVARCGMSGELLGPPNHHSFNARVHEMLRTRYPDMSEEAYRSRIEMVRDPEVIEQWRQQCTKKKIFRRKDAAGGLPAPAPAGAESDAGQTAAEESPKAPPMERDVAEMIFMREIVPTQVSEVKHLTCTSAIALQTPSRPLFYAIRGMLDRERRFPVSLFFALRGAFRHRKLHIFRANDPKGPEFVMLREPTVLDQEHVVQMLKDVLAYVTEHPGCTDVEMLEAVAKSDAEKKEAWNQLSWLDDKGHVIHYYNGVLSAPMPNPAFHFLPGEKGAPKGQSVTQPETSPLETAGAEKAPEAAAPAEKPAEAPVHPSEPVAAAGEPAQAVEPVAGIPAEPPAGEPAQAVEPVPEAPAEPPAGEPAVTPAE